jgi:DNA-binding MarR family transcriptional regulator
MTQIKIQGKFYPLQHEELLNLNRILNASELSIYLWLKTKNPFEEKLIEANTQEIAEDLEISRRTVQRALVKLQQENLIDLVIDQFKYRIKSKSISTEDKSEIATPTSSGDTEIVATTPGSSKRHQDRSSDTNVAEASPVSLSSSETHSEQQFQLPKTIKTYLDFIDSLSESERENFLGFVTEQIKNFAQPINDLEAWLASNTKAGQNRWQVYYQKYRKQDLTSSSTLSEAQRKAIASFQKHLEQHKKHSIAGDRA